MAGSSLSPAASAWWAKNFAHSQGPARQKFAGVNPRKSRAKLATQLARIQAKTQAYTKVGQQSFVKQGNRAAGTHKGDTKPGRTTAGAEKVFARGARGIKASGQGMLALQQKGGGRADIEAAMKTAGVKRAAAKSRAAATRMATGGGKGARHRPSGSPQGGQFY